MSSGVWGELGVLVKGELRYDEPLNALSTYRIGGPAAGLLSPHHSDDVVEAVRFCNDKGLRWIPLGLGSNVLIADAGFPGLVVRLGKEMGGVLHRMEEDTLWRIAAGMPTPRLVRQTANAGLAGVEGLIGVPGTVGGGVATNAGANGQDFSQVLESIELVRGDGTVEERPGKAVDWAYRYSGLEEVVVTAATMRFRPTDREELEECISQHLARRGVSTPFNEPCCGSVFKNPGVPESGSGSRVDGGESLPTAGALIDAAGLKGFRVGAAEVSKKHANYIVNLGGATAAEVRSVIDVVQGRVFGEFGVELELEVRIIE